MKLSVLYRGPLASCNYGCSYCPFAKRSDTKQQLVRDRQSLEQFTECIAARNGHEWKLLFTPWGEALVRPWYRQAITRLTNCDHVRSVAVQTNLSARLEWVTSCRRERLAFWATYHPTEIQATAFLKQVQRLREWGVRLSVGMVAVPRLLPEIESFRRRLPGDVYLWINAQQPRCRDYTEDEATRLAAIDPMFPRTMKRQFSLGKPCRSGETSFTLDGRGEMRRCHFVAQIIGNFYQPDWEQSLQPRDCPRRFCDCFLGQAQLNSESFSGFFGDQLLERVPMTAWNGERLDLCGNQDTQTNVAYAREQNPSG